MCTACRHVHVCPGTAWRVPVTAGACDGGCEEEMIVCEVGHGRDGEIQGAWSVWGCVRWLLIRHVCADVCACHRCVLPPGSAEWGGCRECVDAQVQGPGGELHVCEGAVSRRCEGVGGVACGCRQCARVCVCVCGGGSCLGEAASLQPGLEGCFPRPGCCWNRGRPHEHTRRGSEAHSWALTHTDAQGQTYPPLSSLFLSPGVSGFQRSLHEDCLLCSSPQPPAWASSNTVMPSRQLCGSSCLNHLKADGWVEIRCCPPGSEEAALLLWPGRRLRQMDEPPFPVLHTPSQGLGVGRHPPPPKRGSSRRPLSRG